MKNMKGMKVGSSKTTNDFMCFMTFMVSDC